MHASASLHITIRAKLDRRDGWKERCGKTCAPGLASFAAEHIIVATYQHLVVNPMTILSTQTLATHNSAEY
jgi:hypothetical protein